VVKAEFSSFGPALALAAAAWSLPATASAQELRLGLIAPTDGTLAIIGEQAGIALDAFATSHTDLSVTIIDAVEPCSDANAAGAAELMVDSDVDAVIGLFCAETVNQVMPILAEADIPAISVSLRAGIVMEDALAGGWPLFRIAPSAEAEATAIAQAIAARWSDEPFALIEDGTIYGRDLAETVRLELEQGGITPSFIDNYRPAEELQFGLVRRLAAAGVSHVFVGGDRADVAIMARDAAQAGLNLTFMGGDALQAADGAAALPDGVLAMVAERPSPDDDAVVAIQAIETLLRERDDLDRRADDAYLLPIYAAAEIAAAAEALASSAETDLAETLRTETFATAIGPVEFGTDQSDEAPYVLRISQDGRLVPLDGTERASR
jgi:branched-chain amino acid transport system substrate-binding protein